MGSPCLPLPLTRDLFATVKLVVVLTGRRRCWLQVGTVWINCWLVRDLHVPFGGKKSSGTGREGLNESMEFFTEVKTTCCQLAAP